MYDKTRFIQRERKLKEDKQNGYSLAVYHNIISSQEEYQKLSTSKFERSNTVHSQYNYDLNSAKNLQRQRADSAPPG